MKPKYKKPNFTRAVMIFLSKNGVFIYAKKGTKRHELLMLNTSGFLPATTVARHKDARSLQVRLCKLDRLPGAKHYKFPMTGTLHGLDIAAGQIEAAYQNGNFVEAKHV